MQLSGLLDFTLSVIAAAFAWVGTTVGLKDQIAQDLINIDDPNTVKDGAIAACDAMASQWAGSCLTPPRLSAPPVAPRKMRSQIPSAGGSPTPVSFVSPLFSFSLCICPVVVSAAPQ